MSSHAQFKKEVPGAIPNASVAGKSRLFQDANDDIWKSKDVAGVVTPISGASAFVWNVVGPINNAGSPYLVTGPFETVRVDPSTGPVTINLFTAVGNAGVQVKVKNITVDVTPITVDAFGAETIDGGLTWVLITPREFVVLESDGTNWMVVG